jgi:hypothetical protein
MLTKRETHLIALNDLDAAREAVENALDGASSDERPGLQRALEIIDAVSTREDPRRRWTRNVLDEAGIDVHAQEVHAVKAVRERLPGLSLSGAVGLVNEVKNASKPI